MKEPTKADLAAAVIRLTGENESLRDLLAAVSAYADVPHPASYDNRDNRFYECELERRLDAIAIYASGRKDMDPGVYVLVIQDRAKHLREEAARPVRYEVRAEPEPEPAEAVAAVEFTSDSRLSSARCQEPGEHSRELAGAVVDCDRPEHHEAAATVTA